VAAGGWTRVVWLVGALCLLGPARLSSGDDDAFTVSAWVDLDAKSEARALDEAGRSIDEVDLFNFGINPAGGLSRSTLSELDGFVTKLRAKNARAYVTFIDWVGSAHDVVDSPVLRRAFARNAASASADHALEGVDLDFERLERSQRASFTALCRELARELHARGKKLSVTVIARTAETELSGAQAAQDLGALGTIADRVKLMTYDYAGSWSEPDPIGPLDWAKRVVAQAVAAGVPRSKLMLGVPLYGRLWPGGTNLAADDARALAAKLGVTPKLDEARGEVTFHARGKTVWFTDARAVAAKTRFARAEGLGGICLFSLGWARDPELRALERARHAGVTEILTPR
jgi:spore germination protein